MALLRIAGTIGESIVDGPGIRYVVFTQGCPHGCPGCHNPQTHDFAGGKEVSVDTLLTDITKNAFVKAVTLSGMNLRLTVFDTKPPEVVEKIIP